MQPETSDNSDLIYGLDDRPSRNAPPRQPQGGGNSSPDLDDEIPFA